MWKGQKKKALKILFGKPNEKTPFGRYRCEWENDIQMTLKMKWRTYELGESGSG